MESKGEYRYPGSRPFEDTDIDRMLFFGREREKEELLQKIIARKLVVLHAESGLGKTSLLNAGVSGLLKDRGFLPIKIRFNFAVISPIQAVFSGIEETRARQSLDVEAGETETLWHYFKTAAFWSADDSLLTPVLILDQFEEFFTFHEPEVRNEFISQLADLVHNTIPSALRQVIRAGELYRYGEEPPRVKIVISIRGDFLGQLDELSSAIPEILENRYRLSPLSRSQAREAITRPAQLEDEQMLTRRFRYSEDALNMMLDYLSKRQERGGVVNKDEIESFQLQLLCRHIETNILEKASKASGQDEFVIKKEDLGGEAGIHKVFQYFYEDRLTGLKSARDKRHVRRMCEKGLISDSDRRLSLEEEVIEKQFKVSSTLLAQLVDNRLLRAEKRVGSVYYELSHDTLIKPIRLSQRNPMDTLFKEAENFAFEYDFDKAIEKYNIILKKDPKNKKAIVKLGELLMRSRKYKDSIKLYKKAIANEITDARVYAGLWKAFFKIRKDDQAIKYLKEAIKCNPGQADAYEALGDYYADKKDFKIAIENYEEVLAIDDKYRAVYEKLAVLYGEIGEKEKAIDVFKRAIKVDVEFAEIYQEIRDVLKKKNDMKTLETLCGLALQVKSKDVNYFYWLGYDYHELKKYDTSIEICRKALELKPDDAYVYNLM
ncbi:MAG TPA: tetratricopeptide repeat protein, partial [Candidatus Deferrimicrobium sp.]|nr:tetratricopeptide repeat protein [Candidatus Deferrimicrobium sp.]